MALVTDFTLITYNSYFDLAEVDALVALLEGVRNISKWALQSDTQKENLILASVKDINGYQYLGTLNASVIAPNMQFPRKGLTYENGVEIANDVIPDCLGDYTAYRVLERIDNQSTSTTSPGQNIKKQKLGDLEQEFFNNRKTEPSTNPIKLPSFEFIERFIIPGTFGGNTVALFRT
jgi:hypothetical protein